MPPHFMHTLAGLHSAVRDAPAGEAARRGLAEGLRCDSRRSRARLVALRVRAPETLRARIRRELQAAREAAAR